ncbi:putative intracellular septation protein A [Alsobacter metallidurans]|uniref:Inner membrane-spanning protein YciB n=1 Tax=Alsobacter metallidurans TaxID=340221 RepID=A0A917IC17_9HYPH|nr:putative intracellular septation protein A [Alsobacter metallidurans]
MTQAPTAAPEPNDDSGLLEGPPLRALNPMLKLALEMGPLVVFFLANQRAGIFMATGLFMGAVLISLAASYALTRRLPIMPMVTAVVVLVFGGLTLYLQDDHFIKLKPTIVNSLFGVVLLGGLAFGKPLLPVVLDTVFRLDHEGWRKLTFRWGLFFFALAAINEVVWRTQTTDFWVNFKVFGIMPLTLAFALSQTPLILKHEIKDEAAGE